MNRNMRWAALPSLLVTLASVVGVAAEKRPLPPFDVTTPAGATVGAASLGTPGQWLMVYVAPDSAPSARLVKALQSWQSPALVERTVIVIGGTLADARRFVDQQVGAASSLRWVADPASAGWKALRLSGTPTLVGVKDGRIEWVLAGVLNDPKALESVVRSWVEPR